MTSKQSTTSPPGSICTDHHRGGGRRCYASAVVTFVLVMVGGALPTPLYVQYSMEFGFGPSTVTVVFASYAIGTLTALLLFGHLSDQMGRRPILFAAIFTGALSTSAFLCATNVPWLIAGRFLSGAAIGLVTSAATAALAELQPSGDHARASLVATAANMAGIGAGPVVAGALAAWAPEPTKLVFWIYLAVLGIGFVVAVAIPETAPGIREKTRFTPQRPSIPANLRQELPMLGAAIVAGFGSMGVLTALVPTFLHDMLDQESPFVAGSIVSTLFAAVVLVQIAVRHQSSLWAIQAGLVCIPAGLALSTVALATKSLVLLPIGLVVAGAGVGATFSGTLTRVQEASDDDDRAATLTSYFIVAYCAVALPTVAIGFITSVAGVLPAAITVSAVSSLATLIGAAGMVHLRRKSGSGQDP